MVNMKLVLAACVIISLTVGAPISEDAQDKILQYENDNDGIGNYKFSFETSNGISRSETGKLVNVGEPGEHLEVQGVYSYTDPEGKLVVVHYSADENGYHIDRPPIVMPDIGLLSGAISPNVVATLLG